MDVYIGDLQVGEEATEVQPVYADDGTLLGEATITTVKIKDENTIMPLSENYQDYWRSDGTYSSSITIRTNNGPVIDADANYKVSSSCSNLNLNSLSIEEDSYATGPLWRIDTLASGKLVYKNKTGTNVYGERRLMFTQFGTGLGTPFITTAGVKILPSDPGYVRVYISVKGD